jgi:colanic acid biosynthesis glycosyl transferase WcaI
MQIILLSQWFDPEPGATKGLPFAKWLQDRGHVVKVLTGFPNYPGGKIYEGYRIRLFQREVLQGVHLLRVPLYPSHDSSAFKRILNFFSFAISAATIGVAGIGDADVAYVYHPPPTIALAAMSLKFFRGIPFVYHIADMWPDTVIDSGMVRNRFLRCFIKKAINMWCNFVYKQAEAITVLSPGFKDILVERGVASNKIHVIYNWTDESAFRPAEPDHQLARNLGFENKFNVVYAGNLGPMQGLEVVISASVMLLDQSDIQFVIVGTGIEEGRLKLLAQELGATNVRFLGRRQFWEMVGINTLSDVMFVHLRNLSFFSSTIPGKTQVALASGRPILMAVAGDAADLVKRAGAGLSCPPEDPEAIASAIRKLHGMTAEERAKMGRNGLVFYKEEISISVGGARTEAILESVRYK